VLEPVMARRQERGLSLVELLVGAAVGLIVVAAAGSVVAAHQGAARRVQLEARLMQDLRGAGELVSRDLRRAGHWAAAASGVRRGDEPIIVNPHAEIAAASGALPSSRSASRPARAIRRASTTAERFGFRLRNGAIEVQLGARNWQALSDQERSSSPRSASSARRQADSPRSAPSRAAPATRPVRRASRSAATRSASPAARRSMRS
jgi:type IV pilus assembly protein PilW